MKKKYFIAGISTEVGKTVASAILVQALGADYWKPVQSGDLHDSDTMKVQKWTTHPNTTFHPEAYQLKTPMSPHAAAEIDGVRIDMNAFSLPPTQNHLIVEGAGGLIVPLNEKDTMLDLMEQLALPTILVSRHYLGSINHTLMSIALLKQREIPIAGILFNGDEHPTTEAIITKMSGVSIMGRINELDQINQQNISNEAKRLSELIKVGIK